MISLQINGRRVEVREGVTVAVVLLQAGAQRNSVSGEPREPTCGMGICWECRATVDGVPGVRSCLVTATDGMEVETHD